MDWIDIKDEKPDAGNFETVDVWVCCGSKTYAASWIKHKDDKEGRFYIDMKYPHQIFKDITKFVTHWQYTIYPWEAPQKIRAKTAYINMVLPAVFWLTKIHANTTTNFC